MSYHLMDTKNRALGDYFFICTSPYANLETKLFLETLELIALVSSTIDRF